MRIAVIGGVQSTDLLLVKLAEHGFDSVKIWGYEPGDTREVSSWVNLRGRAESLGFPFEGFQKVSECCKDLELFKPDVLFAVGLSQIIPREMFDIASWCNIGFHPTALPIGRGRAPIAWLAYEGVRGAATFFLLSEGVDNGPILVQEGFDIIEEDDAETVTLKALQAQKVALERLLPQLAERSTEPKIQDEGAATWYGRRAPQDGLINWNEDAKCLIRQIRAANHPHPGAFTYHQDETISIWKASVESKPIKGVVGRILEIDPSGEFLVQTGSGPLRIHEWTSQSTWSPKVGVLLGYSTDYELHRLRRRCSLLEQELDYLKCLFSEIKSNNFNK